MIFHTEQQTQNVTISPVAFVANQMKVDLSAPSTHIDKVSSASTALQDTGDKLGQIAEIKKEMLGSLGPAAKGGGSIHAIPEAEGVMSFGGMVTDMALTGIGAGGAFLMGAPLAGGVALAGVASAVMGVGALMKFGSTVQHQGTIHFGEQGVQGGTMGLNEQIGGKKAGGYTDVLGETWDGNTGTAIKTAAPIIPPQGSSPNAKKMELKEAVAAANEMFTPKQMLEAIFSESEAEKSLKTANNSLRHRLLENGTDMTADAGAVEYENFKESLKSTPAPKKIMLNVGMGAPSGPGMG